MQRHADGTMTIEGKAHAPLSLRAIKVGADPQPDAAPENPTSAPASSDRA
jgi:hypothetical protein